MSFGAGSRVCSLIWPLRAFRTVSSIVTAICLPYNCVHSIPTTCHPLAQTLFNLWPHRANFSLFPLHVDQLPVGRATIISNGSLPALWSAGTLRAAAVTRRLVSRKPLWPHVSWRPRCETTILTACCFVESMAEMYLQRGKKENGNWVGLEVHFPCPSREFEVVRGCSTNIVGNKKVWTQEWTPTTRNLRAKLFFHRRKF